MTSRARHGCTRSPTPGRATRATGPASASFPYRPEAYALLLEQVTERRVLEAFAHKGASQVTRYELPNLPALNFVIDDVLQGGVNAALNLDQHGKTLSSLLLALPVTAPARLMRGAGR